MPAAGAKERVSESLSEVSSRKKIKAGLMEVFLFLFMIKKSAFEFFDTH